MERESGVELKADLRTINGTETGDILIVLHRKNNNTLKNLKENSELHEVVRQGEEK